MYLYGIFGDKLKAAYGLVKRTKKSQFCAVAGIIVTRTNINMCATKSRKR